MAPDAIDVTCEQAPKWGIGRKEKLASRASGAQYGGEKESVIHFLV